MEPVQAQSMQITDTKPLCSSPPNPENGVEEISKQLENELLYGGTDDGDALSDDALSEDSYRLRVSDDENEEAKVDACKIVENHDNNLVDKTELEESTPEVLTTNGETLLDKINGTLCKNGRNGGQNSTEDFVLEQNNIIEDKTKVNSEACIDEADLSSVVTETNTSVNSHKPLSDIDSDNEYHDCDLPEKKDNDIEQIESRDSPKVLPISEGDSLIEEKAEDSSKTDSSSNVIDDKHDNKVEKELDDSEDISASHEKTKDIILENSIEDSEGKGINEQGNDVPNSEQTDEKDDCQIVNSADNDSLTEKPSNPEDIDEHSKEESIKDDDISPVDDKSSETVNLPSTLETSEIISDIGSEKIEEQKDSPSVKTSDDVLGSSKRRLSSSEIDTSSNKLLCVEASPQEPNKAKSIDDAIEILDETDETAEKPIVTNHILKNLLVDTKRSKVDDEIIDVDDDNTIDSSSSGMSLSANDSLTTSDSTNDKTKLDSVNKETPGEKVKLDATRTRRTRSARGEQLGPGRDVVPRTKREAAQKAGETVRKNIVTLNNGSDSESSDSGNKVPYTPKPRAPSPASLKRNHIEEHDERVDSSTVKKLKTEMVKENAQTKSESIKAESKKTFESVRKFFLRDGKDRLKKLTQEELEELFIQKIVETITMREEIGKLREKAKISERNQEATRLKCQQLSKQINDFDMVLNRYSADRRSNGTANPIKINRSVGLQVNFLTDHGVQNLRQLQQAGKVQQQPSPKLLPKHLTNGSTPPQNEDVSGRRHSGLKVRSPRRTDGPVTPVSATSQNTFQPQPLISTMTPSSIALSKPVNTHTTASTGQTIHHVVVNGITNSITRTTKVLPPNKNNAKLIDLTDEEEKKNSAPPPLTAIISSSANSTNVPKGQARYQRVPGTNSVTIPQSAIRVVQPAGQPTPTALVNNMNNVGNMGGPPRFVVMQPARQLVIAPSGNQIRATTANNRGLSNIAYASVPTMPNGTVRVVPTSGTTVQLYKVTHPAPLPDVTTYPANPVLKLPPPAPSLKISKVAHGIVLSWNMATSDKYADIASYQLYAYQEISGMAPASSNWKKVGDVRALPLPMACTLTQFSEGNNYYFAVRAVDTHSRYGQYSQPGNISL